MNQQTLVDFYEKIERLVAKLPTSLQKPILHEITPVKELFLLQRPPRIAFTGEPRADKAALINALFGAEIVKGGGDEAARWKTIARAGHGSMRALDGRLFAS